MQFAMGDCMRAAGEIMEVIQHWVEEVDVDGFNGG
jgi:pullulanase/glycogen debranching enzyme